MWIVFLCHACLRAPCLALMMDTEDSAELSNSSYSTFSELYMWEERKFFFGLLTWMTFLTRPNKGPRGEQLQTGLINCSKEEMLMESLLFMMAKRGLGGYLISVS